MNSKIQQLRSRVRELEGLISAQEQSSNRRIQQIQQEQKTEIEAIKRRVAEDVRRNQANSEAMIERFQEEMVSLHNRTINKLRDEYNLLEKKVEAYRREYESCITQLKSELEALKKSLEKSQQAEATNAEIEIERLEKEKQATEDVPHDFFCKGKYDIYVNELDEAKALKKCGMFQAAIAVAISAQISLQILRNDVKRGLGTWNEIYMRYKHVVESVFHQLETKEYRPKIANCALYDDLLLDFWTEGEFIKKLTEVKVHMETIKTIDEEGPVKYLKKNRSTTKEQLVKDTDRMLIMPKEQNIMYSFAKSALEKSVERFCFLQELSDYYCETQNFEEEFLSFESAICSKIDDSFRTGLKWAGMSVDSIEDIREACHLKLVHAGAEYYFSIYPHKKKTYVENVLVWHFRNQTRANQMGTDAEKNEILLVIQNIREKLKCKFNIEFADVVLKNSEEEIQGIIETNKSEFVIDVTEAEKRAILRRNR